MLVNTVCSVEVKSFLKLKNQKCFKLNTKQNKNWTCSECIFHCGRCVRCGDAWSGNWS